MTLLGRKNTVKFDGDTVTRVKCPSSLSRGNQHEGLNNSLNPRRGNGGIRGTREKVYPARTPQPHYSWEIQKFYFPEYAATYGL